MKKLTTITIAIIFATFAFAGKGDKNDKILKASPAVSLKDVATNIDMALLTGEQSKYVQFNVATGVNLGCVGAQDYFTIYLENGQVVDLTTTESVCGDFNEDSQKATYKMTFELTEDAQQALSSNKIAAIEVSGSHGFLAKETSRFSADVKQAFEGYFMKHIN